MKFVITNSLTLTKLAFGGMGLCVAGLVIIQFLK